MVKTYEYKVIANVDKIKLIEDEIYPEWVRLAKILMKRHIKYYYRHGEVHNSNKLYKDIETKLSERYKDCVNRQVAGMLKTKIKNTTKRLTKITMRSSLSDELKRDLCILFKYGYVFKQGSFQTKNCYIDAETVKLARWMFKSFVGKMPSTKNINMSMNDKVALIQEPLDVTHKDIKYIIKLSTPTKGKPIYIPLNVNKYADLTEGKLSLSSTFVFKKGKLKCVNLTKEVEIIKDETLNDLMISFDIGLNTFVALNNGERYGQRFMRDLKRLDKLLIHLTNVLKTKHGKHCKLSEFEEYNKLNHRIKHFIRNEVNRIVNLIYRKYKPTKIAIEELNFKKSKLYSETNRLLGRFGLGDLYKKIEQLSVEKGIKIVYVDPAYTSQTCSHCGYLDKRNRPNRDEFKCLYCGSKIDADVNGSRCVKIFAERFSEKRFNTVNDRSKKVKLILDNFVRTKFWTVKRSADQNILKNKYFAYLLNEPDKTLVTEMS